MEYFTIGHPPVFSTDDPSLLGLGWGVIATWWVGAILGVPLATVARIGSWPKRSAGALIRPMAVLFACNAIFALIAGSASYIAASNGWLWLEGSLAEQVPKQQHTGFLIDICAHSASYFGGLVGGIMLMAWVV